MNSFSILLLFGFVPSLFAGLMVFNFHALNGLADSFFWFLLVSVVFDFGHIFFTVPPAIERARLSALNRWGHWTMPLIALAVCLAFCLSSYRAFMVFLGYATIFHVMRQQWGIFKAIVRQEYGSATRGRMPHYLVLWMNMLFPILHWHSAASKFAATYISAEDLFRFLPAEPFATLAKVVPLLFAGYLLALTARAFRQKRFPLQLFVMQMGTFLWYFGGLVLSPRIDLFFMTGSVVHGGTYIAYTILDQERKRKRLALHAGRPRLRAHLAYVIPVLAAIALWYTLRKYSFAAFGEQPALGVRAFYALLWTPAIFHYVADAVIWRSSVNQRLRAAASPNHASAA